MLFYGITAMHYMHVLVAACMIHTSIFFTKYSNFQTPLGIQYDYEKEKEFIIPMGTDYRTGEIIYDVFRFDDIKYLVIRLFGVWGW